MQQRTDVHNFKNPHSLANKLGRVAWGIVWAILFRPTPRMFGPWRNMLLRMFGAKIGRSRLHQSVRVWAPWQLKMGDWVYIDRGSDVYNAYGVEIGDRVVISMGTLLCTASHDHTVSGFPLIGGKITIGSDVWIAAEAFVAPGISIADGAVVGARAVVVKDVEPWSVVAGNPARFIKKRELTGAAASASRADDT